MAFLLIFLLAFLAIAWIVYEPVSGVIGSTFIAKVIAVIIAFKIFSWLLAWVGF